MRPLPLGLALATSLVVCPSAARADDEAPKAGLPEAHGAFEPGMPAFADVLAKAKAASKPVFLDVYTTWCGPCKMLDRDVFPKPEVVEALAAFVCARYDAEKDEGVEVARRYGVDAYPTLLVLDADGAEVDRILGFRPVKGFLAEVERIRRGEGTLPALRRALETDPDDFAAAIALARREAASDEAAARRRLEGVLARAHGKDGEAEAAALLALAGLGRRGRDPMEVAGHLATLLREHGTSRAAGKVAGVLGRVLFALPARTATALLEQARTAAREPEDVREVEQLAYVWHQQQAADALKKWAAAAASDGQALNEVAWTAYLQKIAPEDAVRWARRAVELSERDPAVLDTLACLLFAAGQVDEAIELEEEALRKVSDRPEHQLEFALNVAMWKAARDARALFAARERLGDVPAGRAPGDSR
jgi:thiol-disulfide isomerase/thioredoxin